MCIEMEPDLIRTSGSIVGIGEAQRGWGLGWRGRKEALRPHSGRLPGEDRGVPVRPLDLSKAMFTLGDPHETFSAHLTAAA